jgi:hypothetical protein
MPLKQGMTGGGEVWLLGRVKPHCQTVTERWLGTTPRFVGWRGRDRFVFFGGGFAEDVVAATLCGEGKKSVGMWPVV